MSIPIKPPRPRGAVPELKLSRPLTAKEKKVAAGWIGDGQEPNPSTRRICVVYRLSQAGQREAFLTTKPGRRYGEAVSCAQMRCRWLQYDKHPEEFSEAFELAWLSPDGYAYVLIGGQDAFEYQGGGRWEVTTEPVPDRWEPTRSTACPVGLRLVLGQKWYPIQIEAPPLSFDDPNISTHDLLDAERVRRFEIKQSKAKAAKQAEKNQAEEQYRREKAFEKVRKHDDELCRLRLP